jgi:uncharacterized OB-fold protein
MDLEFNYTAGRVFSRFFRELKGSGRIMATRCAGCGQVYLPPRPFCGQCHRRLTDWVEVGPEGVLVGFTSIYFSFYDGALGATRPTPFGAGLIRLDGADTALNHYLSEGDVTKLKIGQRVKAVFRDEKQGNIGDILYFQVLEE